MNRLLLILSLCWGMTLCSYGQNAKSILDKAAATFTQKGVIKAGFTLKSFTGQKQTGAPMNGTILLSGKKFKLNAGGITTWFDGKTQWTFVPENEEVNVTEPTDEELQAINPYNFLNFYKKGYTYKMGKAQKFMGKDIYEVQLTAKKKDMDIKQVVLFIDKRAHQLLQIKFRQGTNSWMSITVNSFSGNQKTDDSTFRFTTKDAPNAEIIDLR